MSPMSGIINHAISQNHSAKSKPGEAAAVGYVIDGLES